MGITGKEPDGTADGQKPAAWQVLYTGHVQGVGFRRRAERLAEGYPVAGYVQNLADGRVELVAEGEATAVRHFLAAVAAAMRAEITAVDERQVEPAQYKGFVQRR